MGGYGYSMQAMLTTDKVCAAMVCQWETIPVEETTILILREIELFLYIHTLFTFEISFCFWFILRRSAGCFYFFYCNMFICVNCWLIGTRFTINTLYSMIISTHFSMIQVFVFNFCYFLFC